MNKKKLNTIYDYLIALQDLIEQGEKTSPEAAYQEMGKLIRSLRIKFLELSGVKTDYRGNLLVSEKDWKKLKQAGTELDEIVE
jgi:hypothetical protein